MTINLTVNLLWSKNYESFFYAVTLSIRLSCPCSLLISIDTPEREIGTVQRPDELESCPTLKGISTSHNGFDGNVTKQNVCTMATNFFFSNFCFEFLRYLLYLVLDTSGSDSQTE